MAAADGIVLVAMNYGYNTGYGQMIVINHKVGDRNIQTVYAHARKIYVTAGQVVSKGQMIAEVGRTGRATGTHLHFEINGAANPFHNNPNYGL
jgi:murein DD-endopeptidase MepM/ murein hydrolase activator NlpD